MMAPSFGRVNFGEAASLLFHPLAACRPPSNAPVLSGAQNPSKQSCSPSLVHAKQIHIAGACTAMLHHPSSLKSKPPCGCMEQAGRAAGTFLTSCGENAACGLVKERYWQCLTPQEHVGPPAVVPVRRSEIMVI